MDLTSKRVVKNLLKKYQLRPSKGLGQNFLIDKEVLGKIIGAAELKPEDTVLEIGPGIGTLTQELAKKVKKVIAVEKDKRMVEILKETLKDFKNAEIIQGDILKIENWKLIENSKLKIGNSYKVVGNLPFYLTAPVIRQFLELPRARPREMVLVSQKEVAERICAKPPKMNLLAVSVQFYSRPEVVYFVSKKSFWPQPEVDAAILKIQILKTKFQNINKDLFFKIVKSGFSQPRKQLINNLSNGLDADKIKTEAWLRENNIQPSQRAETLTVKEWIKLAITIK